MPPATTPLKVQCVAMKLIKRKQPQTTKNMYAFAKITKT